MLRHLKAVSVVFCAADPRAVSARELLTRISSDSAKKVGTATRDMLQIMTLSSSE
jgi:hypothetical protein